MAEDTSSSGSLVLEKELTCSICTDIMYQPLTLLDCLHTFCGSCLKEWFSWQATSAVQARRTTHPYTCPSCRAEVRGTRPNATVTTLLDMYLTSHPGRSKSEAEKEEMRNHYKPGEDVIPPVVITQDSEDSEDERLMDEVRMMSMADIDPAVAANRRAQRTARRDDRRRNQHGSHNHHRESSHRREHSSRQTSQQPRSADVRPRGQETDDRPIEHQPSLRSLLSASETDSLEVQEEIMQSILSSGILEGIDIDHLTTEQEEELTERIAEAYRRRRHRQRERSRNHERRARTDSEPRPASSGNAERRPRTRVDNPEGARGAIHAQRTRTASGTQPPAEGIARTVHPLEVVRRQGNTNNHSTPTLATSPLVPDTSDPVERPFSAANFAPEPVNQDSIQAVAAAHRNANIPEVSCNRCAKENIQHDLHYHCYKCNDGDYDLCLDCYRAGRGCNHWFGFGYAAWPRYQRAEPPEGYPVGHEPPHTLLARKYPRPGSSDQPLDRPQEGAFCDLCHSFANATYWHCYICLEGAWGCCAPCLNRGHHCTHPLLPVAHTSTLTNTPNLIIPIPHLPENQYVPLPIRQDCDVCHYPIPPAAPRFHCHACNAGDYDVCADCYAGLAGSGKIAPANGPAGWRRCPQGHRMAVVSFQETPEGALQRRVKREMVGGWALKEDEASVSAGAQGALPPDGGVGLRCLALWGRFEAAEDELSFPKNAEVREAERMNEDWFWGVYAGMKGLFPGNHVRLL
ncbi:hypothetical protein WHR41_02502 [Cladosporium halotolerans]|uniref:RING-type domain-containing protein n=1 Tax=Cladosporium halotolerans TaxID=1052096 RepID=A0AB34KUZ7_9PEZI